MCIRDRPSGFHVVPVLAYSADPGPVAVVDPAETALVSRVPVSYTHLRAHETVLDLVCRLLLEKKKNTITHRHDLTAMSTTTHELNSGL